MYKRRPLKESATVNFCAKLSWAPGLPISCQTDLCCCGQWLYFPFPSLSFLGSKSPHLEILFGWGNLTSLSQLWVPGIHMVNGSCAPIWGRRAGLQRLPLSFPLSFAVFPESAVLLGAWDQKARSRTAQQSAFLPTSRGWTCWLGGGWSRRLKAKASSL